MSTSASQASAYYNIVSSGLILNLDASNSNSYSGSGTSWYDLSGNSDTATLYNTPTYSAATNGGVFSFAGGAGGTASQYAKLQNISTDFSSGFSATFYADFGTADNWERLIDFGNGNQASNILIARSGGSNDLYFEVYGDPSSAGAHDASTLGHCSVSNVLNNSGFHHWGITFTKGTCGIYRDGVSMTLATNTFSNGTTISSVTKTSNYIGQSNWSADNFFAGSIGKIALYNRALTSNEVYQNYQAQADTCNATQSNLNGWTIFKITTTGTCQWFRPTAATSVEALIVGGGGAGGYDVAGGGGAGGLLYYGSENPKTPNGSALSLNQESYTVTVGAGGSGTSTSVSVSGSTGGDSSFGSYVAKGGGGGNSRNVLTTAATGGSGGGGGLANQTSSSPGMNGGNGTSNQGNKGGNVTSTSSDAGGGGGGAGAAGADRGGSSSDGLAGKGGDGLQYSITGTATYYAGGGGGGSYNSVGGNGGLGGGGHGGNKDQATCAAKYGTGDCGSSDGVTGRQGKPGVANTGGGGGGSGNEGIQNFPGNGGSGVVILRFQNSLAVSAVNSIAFSTQIKKLLANTITATVTAPGKVSFFANGRPIPRCANIATTLVSPFTAQCLWKPLVHGQISVTTSFVPNDVSYTNANGGTSGVATKRTTSR
jgi:Concanavalin A-like lectin/glucanases superfamily